MTTGIHTIHGAPAWKLTSSSAELFVTQAGAHLAPVSFQLDGRLVSPYSLPPWLPQDHPDEPPVMQILRGDFFCFPFGASPQVNVIHGDSANATWSLVTQQDHQLHLRLDSQQPKAAIDKIITLLPGHTAIYQEHRISGVTGVFSYAHHPILHLPDCPCPISTSAFSHASILSSDLNDAHTRSTLKPGAALTSLDQLPLRHGGYASLSQLTSLEDCEECLTVDHCQSDLAWTAVAIDGYLWLSIKRQSDFPNTMFWVSNGGRHFSPWNSSHTRRLGVEDAQLNGRDFQANDVLTLRHIQAVTPLPPHCCGYVDKIDFEKSGDSLNISFSDGTATTATIHHAFLFP